MNTLPVRLFISSIVLVLSFGFFASSAFAETKIGVVDIKKVMETVPDGKKAMAKLKTTMKAKQTKLDKAKKDFDKMRKELSERSVVKQPTQEEARAFEKKAMELQQLYVQMQQELAAEEVKAQAAILKKVQAAASKVAKAKSFTLIIEKSEVGVLFVDPANDLTQDIIKAY